MVQTYSQSGKRYQSSTSFIKIPHKETQGRCKANSIYKPPKYRPQRQFTLKEEVEIRSKQFTDLDQHERNALVFNFYRDKSKKYEAVWYWYYFSQNRNRYKVRKIDTMASQDLEQAYWLMRKMKGKVVEAVVNRTRLTHYRTTDDFYRSFIPC
jgi:hypothetical protein